MRRTQPEAESVSPVARLLARAPKGLRDLLGGSRRADEGGPAELNLSARRMGRVLQVSVANPSRVFLSSIELSLLIEFYDLDRAAQEHRTIEFLSPGEQVLLAIPVESEQVSRLWCTTDYTLRSQRRSATGGIELS